MKRVDVGEKETMLTLDSVDGLLDFVQASVLEIHPWGSTMANLEKPDRLIFDLDPGEHVAWRAVIDGALEIRSRLDALGLTSFVKTSGGKGLHVVLPIEPSANWDDAKAFTQSIAQQMAKARPDRYVATMAKVSRRGRIGSAIAFLILLTLNVATFIRATSRSHFRAVRTAQRFPGWTVSFKLSHA